MAEPRNNDEELIDSPTEDETRLEQNEDIRGNASEESNDVDPDSAEADVDRDDSVTD